ncbi:metal-sulfur cluster assembly factor [Methylobacterium nigriterrae]|uniref:metal-sulfur cluster assembly factor n=1 Tax=Methylobacterium nigriterrae TaxID=3127512 RepID=UPI0030139021
MLSWLRGRATRHAPEPDRDDAPALRAEVNPEVLNCLEDVLDPEVGISVVHLGLVYRAVRTPERIEVDLTLTARTCPLGGLIVEDARTCLTRRFVDCPSLQVRLVWNPIWTPDRITPRGLELLGRSPRAES